MAKFTLNLILVFLLAVFFSGSLQASPQSLPSTVTSEQPSASAATRSPTSQGTQSQPKNKITAYTLPPDLYRKARNRGRIGFASRIIGFFYGLLVFWFILRRKLSAKYRDWAERFSRNRFVQALVFTPLLVLTIGLTATRATSSSVMPTPRPIATCCPHSYSLPHRKPVRSRRSST